VNLRSRSRLSRQNTVILHFSYYVWQQQGEIVLRALRADIQDKRVLQELMQHYLHDLSPYTGERAGADGKYALDAYFDAYWTEDQRHPYLLMAKRNQMVGFALVRELADNQHSVAEFYIAQKYRRAGMGQEFSRILFGLHPGKWVVAEMESNLPAIAFWRKVIDKLTGGRYTETWSDRQPCGPKQEFDFPVK
jgi:predicted acetyltransferase